MPDITRHLLISGRVQGVGYRAWTEREARKLGLYGWVRNRADGMVEALVHGPEKTVTNLIENARSGPLLAKVDDIAVADGDYNGAPEFQTYPTI